MELKQLDARDVRCPDLTVVIRRFLFRQIDDNDLAHVVTNEPLAPERVKHLVHQMNWKLVNEVKQKDGIHFLIQKSAEE